MDDKKDLNQTGGSDIQNLAILQHFLKAYSSAYTVDFKNDTFEVLHMNHKLQETFKMDGVRSDMEKFIETYIYPKDRALMRMITKKGYMAKVLKTQDEVEFNVREIYKDKIRTMRVLIMKGSDENHACVGFMDVTSEIEKHEEEHRLNEQKERKLSENLDIIKTLAAEYSSVYYIDLNNDKVTPYSMNDDTKNNFSSFLKDDVSYTKAFEKYVDLFVENDSKEKMLASGSIENIKKQLTTNQSFNTIYKNRGKGKSSYCEMKIVKPNENDPNPSFVALGFANRDEQICKQFVFEELSREYASIFLVTLDNDYYRFVSRNAASGFKDVPGGSYTGVIKDYANRVHPDYHEEWVKLANIDYVREFLANDNRRELTYKLMGVDDKWRRCILQVIERKNGVATSFIMTYMTLDDSSAEKHELDKTIKEQAALLETQRKEQEKSHKIINKFADRYSDVYLVSSSNKCVIPIRTAGESARTRYVTARGVPYEIAMGYYISNKVIEEEQAQMIEETKFEKIYEHLKSHSSFTYHFRCIIDFEVHYFYMEAVKLDENIDEIVCGFANEDEFMLKEQALKDQLEIVSALSKDYMVVDFVTLNESAEEDEVFNIVASKDLGKTIDRWKDEHLFTKKLFLFANSMVVEEDREQFLKEVKRENVLKKIEENGSFYATFRYLENNKEHYGQLKFVTPDKSKNITNLVVAYQNIDETISKEKEEREMLSKALDMAESSSRSKTVFLSNMSHDIRTPMNAIIGFTNLAKQKITEPQWVENYLNKTMVASQHLLSLINDVLDMSRIESGKVTIDESEFNLTTLIEDLNTVMFAQANAKHINLKTNIVNLKHPDVILDRIRMNQVLLNFLSNAVKFTPNNGNVSITLTELSSKGGIGKYEFRIKDDGIGMNEEFVKKVFEPFEREKTSTVSGTEGTGLGMSIAKSIIDIMGGTVTVNSKVNKGTEFIITLSFKIQETNRHWNLFKAEKTVKMPLKEEDFNLTGMKILLVEDNELNREIATEILNECGVKVSTANDGTDAVKIVSKAKKGQFDVILMDIQMPIMNGYEATQKIRSSNYPLKDIPIIAMTANAFAEDKKAAFEAGMNDHIAKPIDIKILKKTLKHYFPN
ncbi:MAG: response regulator [Bacilli bacterium]|nr:response regulator [Bacilli bacterium]